MLCVLLVRNSVCCCLIIREPDDPVSSVPRNTCALTTSSAILGACDNDFTKFNLTPSVYLVCDIPDDATQSFYCGQPVAIVKDSVFSPSSPYQHMAEFVQLAKESFDEKVVPPLMYFYVQTIASSITQL